jgi:PAS domain S-box-containing protein
VLPDYIFIKNREGQFVLSNLTHAAAAGIADPNALVGKRAHDVFPPQLAEQFDVDDQAVMESGEGLVNVERQSVDSAGNPRWVLTSKLPMRDSQGEVIGVVGISRDITARKQVESQRLDLALEREKVAMLQRFIDAASHDLRTPLTVIKSALDLLRKVDNPEKRQRYLAQLEQQTGRMEALLDEILQLAWLDRAEFEFDPEPQDINALIQAVIDEQTSLAVRKRHSLTFTPAPDLTPIRTNSTELRRAIRHLLINAMNYTPDGGIITVTTARQSNEILIHVADNGIGIRPEHQQQIFERFVRVDPARQTDTGGTGLGLPIVQRIIEAHGGTVTLESTIDVGSTFTIHLPIPT